MKLTLILTKIYLIIVVHPTRLSDVWSSGESECDVSSSDNDSVCGVEEDIVFHMREFYKESKINLKQMSMLLARLKLFHPQLPSDPRTIARTPRSTVVKQLSNGTYVHIGFKSGLLACLAFGTVNKTKRIDVDVNFDGLPASQSSDVTVWPISARSLSLINDKPFVIGVFSGSDKPSPLDKYLEDYIQEVRQLNAEGITYKSVHYEVHIRCYVCDAPARAYMKCIKGHAGHSSCERCVCEGEYISHRMVFEPRVSALRTEESFRDQTDEDHQHGVSPLSVLGTHFVSQFVLDPMHLILQGALKRFLRFLLGKCKTNARLSALQISDINKVLSGLTQFIPRECARKPRSLEFLSRWKATELRLFLLYVGVLALKGNVAEEVYSLFLMFHVAFRIVSSPILVQIPEYLDLAEELLSKFVKHCADKTVFGPLFVVYNVHSLLHLIEDVRKFGDVNSFSAFPFENYLGILKRMVRSGVKIPQQIAHRLIELDNVSEPRPNSIVLTPSSFNAESDEFNFLSCSSFTLCPHVSRDSFFSTDSGIGQVKRIWKTSNGTTQILADVCIDLEDYYSSPVPSSLFGIYKFGAWTERDIILDSSAITGKFMVFFHNDENIAMRLLHTI